MRRSKLYIVNVADWTICMVAKEAPGLMLEKRDPTGRVHKICDLDSEGVKATATIAPFGKPEYTIWECIKFTFLISPNRAYWPGGVYDHHHYDNDAKA